jgi:hypothetical protein
MIFMILLILVDISSPLIIKITEIKVQTIANKKQNSLESRGSSTAQNGDAAFQNF